MLAEHLRELALLNRGLDLSLTDRRGPAGDRSERFHFPCGARDFVALLDGEGVTPVHPDVIGFECEDPRMAGTLEVALRWRDCAGERVRGFANSRATAHGTHLEGLRDGVAAALDAYARTADPVEPAPAPVGPELIGEGLTAVVSVKLDHPEFEGSIRDVLGNHPVRACVAEAVREHLGAWLEEHPERAAAVVARILRGARRS
ncbi:hypothetical protein ACIRS1_06345 [Kitasatospora sp. NPDC101176]|uniref:hypothetical protein n=1 Tax=Kitasatospora sp. NPDC101176 TaxID=3364099 RepID=UPI0038023520